MKKTFDDHPAAEILNQLVGPLTDLLRHCGVSEDHFNHVVQRHFSSDSSLSSTIEHDPDFPPLVKDFLAALLSSWWNESEFLDEVGEPLPLPLKDDGPCIESLFTQTAEEYPDIHALLDLNGAVSRLLDSESIAEDAGCFTALTPHFVMRGKGISSGLGYLSYVRDFVSTTARNAIIDEIGLWQRTARTSGFPVSRLPMMRAVLDEQGMQLLRDIDSIIVSERDAHADADIPSTTVGVGVYLFRVD